MGVIADALMMQLRGLVHPLLLTNKDTLRFRCGFKAQGLVLVRLRCFCIFPASTVTAFVLKPRQNPSACVCARLT